MKEVTNLLRRIDEMLSPRGFHRHKHTWNRRSDALIDVVALELSKTLHAVWVSFGVLDPDVYARAWLMEPPSFAHEPDCTVRSRLADLMGKDAGYWSVGQPGAGEEMAAAIESFALPYLERLHEPEALERTLESSPEATQSYPPPIIYLALLKHRRGEAAEARRLLLELRSRTNDTWSQRVECVMQDVGLAT